MDIRLCDAANTITRGMPVDNEKPRPKRKPEKKMTWHKLRSVRGVPSPDLYTCTTGADDKYLAALKREFPERMP